MFERFLRQKGYIKLDKVNQEIDRLIKREFESKYKGIGESESLLDEYNKLKAELKTPKRFDEETVIRLEADRDLYKKQAEKLFERLLER